MLITVTAALLIIAVYTIILVKKRHPLIEWWNSLIATSVSVILGISVGIFLFNYSKKQSDVVQRQQFIDLLGSELANTRQILSKEDSLTITVGEKNISFLISSLEPSSIQEAAQSNLFNPLQTAALLILSQRYKMFNIKCDHLLNILLLAGDQSRNADVLLSQARDNIEQTRRSILESINFLENELHLDLSDSRNFEKYTK